MNRKKHLLLLARLRAKASLDPLIMSMTTSIATLSLLSAVVMPRILVVKQPCEGNSSTRSTTCSLNMFQLLCGIAQPLACGFSAWAGKHPDFVPSQSNTLSQENYRHPPPPSKNWLQRILQSDMGWDMDFKRLRPGSRSVYYQSEHKRIRRG